jgi:hypothetical protein
MALPTVQDCKDYLRIEHTAEDAMLTRMLAQAVAAIESEIGRPIEYLRRTFILEERPSAVAVDKIFVPLFPIGVEDSSAATMDLTLTDADATLLVEDTDYRLDTRTGVITGIDRSFCSYPYTIVCDVGLEALEEYTTRVEPVLSLVILDFVADRYQRRNPAASQETTGGGVSSNFAETGLPPRIREAVAPWRIYHV